MSVMHKLGVLTRRLFSFSYCRLSLGGELELAAAADTLRGQANGHGNKQGEGLRARPGPGSVWQVLRLPEYMYVPISYLYILYE